MYKKLIVCIMSFAILCGCTISIKDNNDNTTSNITESTTQPTQTTTVDVEPVDSLNNLSFEKIIWGPGTITNHEKPSEPKALQSRYLSLDAHWLMGDEKTICLTFDEGYENGYTPSILDTLKEKGVPAIFFVTYDFAVENPKLISRMIDEGHIVANHSWHHYDMTTVDNDTVTKEISYLHDYIKKEHNYTMSLFRFPEGSFSEQNLGVIKDMGYKSVFWSYAYADWDSDNQPDEETALNGIMDSIHPGEIMLLHAVSKTNAAILPRVIDKIKDEGYTFTVDI